MPFSLSTQTCARLAAGGALVVLLGWTHASCPAAKRNPGFCPFAKVEARKSA